MSLLTIALCLFQMTALLALSGVASRLFRPVAPAQAARIGAAGLMFSLSLLVISMFGVPKPFVTEIVATATPTVQRAIGSDGVGTSLSHATGNVVVESEQASGVQPSIQVSLPGVIQLLDSTVVAKTDNASPGDPLFEILVCLLVIFTILPSLIGLCATAQLHRRSRPVVDADEVRLHEFVPDDAKVTVRFRTSRYTSAPCVTLVGGKTIYLPLDWRDWSREELSVAVAHEMEHLKRHDPLVRLLTQLAASLQRFHPLAIWLHRSVVLSQEMAADQQAADQHNHDLTGSTSGRLEYATTLSKIALRLDSRIQPEQSRMMDWILGAGTLSVSSSQLIRRIEMLTQKPSNQIGWRRRLIAGAATLSIVSAWMVSASWSVRAQPPIDSPDLAVPNRGTPNQESPRIARRVDNERHQDRSETRPWAQPWEDLGGNDTGYAVVHVDALLSNVSMLRQFVTGTVESYLDSGWEAIVSNGSADKRESMGLSIGNLRTIAVGLNFNFVNTEPKDKQDKNSTVTMGANNGRMWFKDPVAHDPIAQALDVQKIAKLIEDGGTTLEELNGKSYEEFTEMMIDGMFTAGATTPSLALSTDEETKEYDASQLAKLQRAWRLVDGGDVTVCFSLPDGLEHVEDRDDELANELLQHASSLGIGFDFRETQCVDIRFAMVPRNGIKDGDYNALIESIESRINEEIEIGIKDAETNFQALTAKRIFDTRSIEYDGPEDQNRARAVVISVQLPVEYLTLLMMF